MLVDIFQCYVFVDAQSDWAGAQTFHKAKGNVLCGTWPFSSFRFLVTSELQRIDD